MRGKGILALVVLVGVMALPGSAVAADGPQLSDNLLKNPGFEGGVVTYDDAGDIKVQVHWTPWWMTGSPEEQSQGYGKVPTYHYGDRDAVKWQAKEGQFSQFWVWRWGAGTAGIYQQVKVPPNSRVRFQVYGYGWSCSPPEIGECPDWSKYPSPLRMQIGLDPTGGTDWYAPTVARSPEQNAYDSWQFFEVEADTGASTTATAFLKAAPDWPVEINQVFWDDAYLVVVASGGGVSEPSPAPVTSTTARPAPAAAPPPATVAPSAPTSYVVQPDDTLAEIAQANGTTIAALVQLNGATHPGLLSNPNALRAGWVLKLPSGGGSAGTAQVGQTYVVQPGDTLYSIARRTGTDVRAMLSLNVGQYPGLWSDPDTIRVGWVLRLP